ncbi:hypothetical protein M0R04_12305 [Candidatus Dojkabacteria bacterium]|jgi:hypothetical protein|nr:hypothetical protein [Candidatus Dojkabacteria bacterium]
MQRLTEEELRDIGIRQSRINILNTDLGIHQSEMQNYVGSLIKKYKLDIKKEYQLDGNYLTEIKDKINDKIEPKDKGKR